MIGLVLVTHGRLGAEYLSVLEHIMGPQAQATAVEIGPNDDGEERRQAIIKAVDSTDSGQGVIVLTDMFGGTPCNVAVSLMGREGVDVIAGVNLPMLLRLGSVRETATLSFAVTAACEAGRKYINVASALLAERKEK